MDLDDLKVRMGIPLDNVDPVRDAKLAADLEDAIDYAKEWCNNQFENGLPPGVKRAIVAIIKSYSESKNVQSQRLGDMSKSFFEGGSIVSAHGDLRPWKKVRFT
ncbi:phage head-tail connector protein [Sporosarcina sp. FSL K6-1508]|uniref:phage head-tail connector protein n=1 Tax=Sporosarcina sp. FSL K6-1508 TaxID=2921553 RepID=UPI0030F4DBB6